jgi:hypothetical protein
MGHVHQSTELGPGILSQQGTPRVRPFLSMVAERLVPTWIVFQCGDAVSRSRWRILFSLGKNIMKSAEAGSVVKRSTPYRRNVIAAAELQKSTYRVVGRLPSGDALSLLLAFFTALFSFIVMTGLFLGSFLLSRFFGMVIAPQS